jgi:hypothetical protein
MKENDEVNTVPRLIKRLITLYVDNARFTVAEKLTMLISAGVMLMISLVLGIFAVAFLSGAVVALLEMAIEPWAAYLLLGGVFVVLIIALFALRKCLIINPVSKFISKLVFEIGGRSSRQSSVNNQDI